MTVRPLELGDQTAWWAMRARLWPDVDVASLRETARVYAGADQVAFVWDGGEGRLLGFAEGSIRRDCDGCTTSPVGYLEGWWVDPEYRRRGIGRALVDAVIAWAGAKGCTEIGSDAYLGNAISQAAHLAIGFRQTEELVHFLMRLEPAATAPVEATAGGEVTLRPVDADNVHRVCDLVVAAHQRLFVAANAVSLAQAYTINEAWPRAVYAGETPVGFVMLHVDVATPRTTLWRFMIDHRYQGAGFGAKAMAAVEAHARTLPGGDRLFLSVVPGPGGPEGFYRSLGYTTTGVVFEGELEMVKPL